LIVKNSNLYNAAERNLLNINLQDSINIKQQLSSSSINDFGLNFIELNEIPGSSHEELEIIEKYNNIIIYNKENKIISYSNKRNLENKHAENNLEKNDNFSDSFSLISPLISHSNLKKKLLKNNKQSRIKYNGNNVYYQRHDSFLIPRQNSKTENN
jgi:hypothetical protein